MSHSKEREEKNCLNCNAVVHGRYCSICGQENLEPQETVWHLSSHFFNDITHFDGKLFSSMKYLIMRPGFLSQEYMAGRRASYLNPVRMYVFTSFIFFLLIFSFFSSEQKHITTVQDIPKPTLQDSVRFKNMLAFEGIDTAYANPERSKFVNFLILAVPGNSGFLKKTKDTIISAGENRKKTADAAEADSTKNDSLKTVRRNSFYFNDYRDRKQYDSLLSKGLIKDNILMRIWRHREFTISEKYGNNTRLFNDTLVETFEHYIPQLFFLSLPLFALFLKLLYFRRRKFYYVAHAIFALHLYIFVYIGILILFTINSLSDLPWLGWLDYILFIGWLMLFFYGYRAMRNFYGQGRGKTFLKFFLLIIWLMIIVIILMAVMLFFSLFKI